MNVCVCKAVCLLEATVTWVTQEAWQNKHLSVDSSMLIIANNNKIQQ